MALQHVGLLLLSLVASGWGGVPLLQQSHRCMVHHTTNKKWEFRPSAFLCEDDPALGSTECLKFFHQKTLDKGSSTADAARDPSCDSIHFQNEATWCAKTCGLCCEQAKFSCSDSFSSPTQCVDLNDTNKVSAADRPKKCQDYAVSGHCLSTCGLCEEHKAFQCKDKHPACIELVALCNEEKHKLRMDKLCANTCGEAIPGNGACEKQKKHYLWRRDKVPKEKTCKDESTGCPQNVMLCENEYYETAMSENCKKTCGYCKPESWKCVDKKTSPCEKWTKHNFCFNEDYPKGMILDHCPAKCALCDPEPAGAKGKDDEEEEEGEEEEDETPKKGGAKGKGGKRGATKKGKAPAKKTVKGRKRN